MEVLAVAFVGIGAAVVGARWALRTLDLIS